METQGKRTYKGKCPMCHDNISVIDGLVLGQEPEGQLVEIFKCTSCNRVFLIKRNGLSSKGYPYFPQRKSFSEDILRISEEFADIYNQAEHARSLGLEKIAGPGFRKALEYLIKDYAIYNNPEKEEEIKGKFLGKVINDNIDDGKIKEIAVRATWLGNDETHFVRVWEDYDIDDLKSAIDLVEYSIISNEKHKRFVEGMERNKEKGSESEKV